MHLAILNAQCTSHAPNRIRCSYYLYFGEKMKNPFQRYARRFSALETRLSFLEAALQTYFDKPLYAAGDDIGFNGQKIRKEIYRYLCDKFNFEVMVETGTYTGNTTGYMAQTTKLPVFTCEANGILAALARKRLSGMANINFYLMDSRNFLESLIETDVINKKAFIYLDAHGYDDLPLKEEIDIICKKWKEFVIMVDDFKVPGDPGYGYDSYGRKNVLAIENFSSVILQNELVPFFPTHGSTKESGAKRGSVILTKKGVLAEQLAKCDLLTQYR